MGWRWQNRQPLIMRPNTSLAVVSPASSTKYTSSPHTTDNCSTAHWVRGVELRGRAEIPLRAAVAHMVTLQGAISLILGLHHTRMQEAGLFRGWQQFHVFKTKGSAKA